MTLSRKTKEAIKLALALTITYAIALQMNWDKPVWAGFAVAFVSLATVGQSFNKAAMRMIGTLVATVVALAIIGLFAQDRWLFMMFLSVWVGYCTYMMGGPRLQYFWNVCGFVSIIICVSSGPDSANAFRIAILRSQETGLGILVYSLVAILLWPTRSRTEFDGITAKLAATQHQTLQVIFGQLANKKNTNAEKDLQTQLVQAQTRFGQLLEAAETDNYEVWEMRQQWQKFQQLSSDFAATVTGWHDNFLELQMLNLHSLMPDLETFGKELDQRFAQVESMLAGQPPEQQPTPIDLTLDEDEAGGLSHFHRAALAVTRTRLLHLELLSRTLFKTIRIIQGFDQQATEPAAKPRSSSGFVFDPDRLSGAIQVIIILWLAYLAMIYIPDIPGGAGIVSMAGPFAMILAGSPQLPVKKLFEPIVGSVLFGAFIHIFVMPQLSTFYELGLLIFATSFGICYLFAAPQQALSKIFGLAMFLSVANIANQQTYSFLGIATTAMMFLLIYLLLSIMVNFPFSARPEKVFLRLLGRYFRSCEYLIHNLHRDTQKQETLFNRWQKNYHVYQFTHLPGKLEIWARFINTKVLPGSSPEQIQAVLAGLQPLSYRVQELLAARGRAQSPFLLQELQQDVRAWRDRAEEILQRLTEEFDAGKKETLGARLSEIIDHLEQRIEETLDKGAENQLSKQDNENFYQLLGAYRGVSQALVEYAGSAHTIDWTRWREERF